MNKAFDYFEWKNDPDHTTPLSAENLNKINDALDEVDDRCVESLGKIKIGSTVYEVVVSTVDAGTAGKITFVVDA